MFARSTIVLSLAMTAVACGTAQEPASQPAAVASLSTASSADALLARPTTVKLPAGDYLVRLARQACDNNELSFSKRYVIDLSTPAQDTTVLFKEESIVDDGKIHTLVCRYGSVASGVVRVKMAKPFTLTSESDHGMARIDAVFSYATLPVRAGEGSLLGKGTYVVDFSMASYCWPNELTFAKSIRDRGQGVEAAIFRKNGVAYDNLLRPMACNINPPRSTGSAVLRATAPSTRLETGVEQMNDDGGAVPVTVGSAQETTPVAPKPAVEAIRMVTELYRVL